jgi:MinD-like ATPase involved in chromosome partitioning or flagellar assembly
MDGPISLVAQGDPYALSADEFVVLVATGREGAAEGYAAVKEVFRTVPNARVRVLVNRVARAIEAHDAFHKISDVCERNLGRQVRSYGGLPLTESLATGAANGSPDDFDAVFSRIARGIASDSDLQRPCSYFDAVWRRQSAGAS